MVQTPTRSTSMNAAAQTQTRAAHEDGRSDSAKATAPQSVAATTVWPEGNEKPGAAMRPPGGAGRPTRVPTTTRSSSPPATEATRNATGRSDLAEQARTTAEAAMSRTTAAGVPRALSASIARVNSTLRWAATNLERGASA